MTPAQREKAEQYLLKRDKLQECITEMALCRLGSAQAINAKLQAARLDLNNFVFDLIKETAK